MTRTLFVDPVAGLAGDMLCGALLDAGGDLDTLRSALRGLGIDGVAVDAGPVRRGSFSCVHFAVRSTASGAVASDHRHHHHHHDGEDEPGAPPEPHFPGQPARTLETMHQLIDGADMPPRARRRARAVFQHLADAEGAMHGQPPEAVHFHEVGGVDAIYDIVAVCLLLEQLDIGRVVCGPLPLGSGTVRCAHGEVPLPAPATVALLRGWPVRTGRPGAERTTPTGAALMAAIATPGPIPPMVLETQGIGAGSRNPDDHANICRVLLGTEQSDASPGDVVVLTAQMDDITGEHLPPLLEALLTAGALDVTATPVLMKKGRSGLAVEALARPPDAEAVTEAMLRHGSTFGVRRHAAQRTVLDRWHTPVDTPWGPVRVKVGALRGEILHTAPEYEDVARVAREAGQPVPRVHYEAIRAVQSAAPPEDPERP